MTIEEIHLTGARLWTVQQGTGLPLVLCHGGPGMWDCLGPVADMVDDLTTVYRYDQRGCGRSAGDPPYDLATSVADLEALREHWGVSSWIVGGHSWGASLALAYCLQHPTRVRALVYISGTGVDPAWKAVYDANEAALLGPEGRRRSAELKERLRGATGAERVALSREHCLLSWATDFADRERAGELAESLLVDGFTVNEEINRVLGADARRVIESEEVRARLGALAVPALVLHGAADPRPAWAVRQLAGLLPTASLAVLPGVGHFPWLERPELMRKVLRGFLEDAIPPRPPDRAPL